MIYIRAFLALMEFIPMVKSVIAQIDAYLDRKAKERLAKELEKAKEKAIETGDTSDLEDKL